MPDNTQEPCNVLDCADNDVAQTQCTHHSHHAVQRFLVKHITNTAPIYIVMKHGQLEYDTYTKILPRLWSESNHVVFTSILHYTAHAHCLKLKTCSLADINLLLSQCCELCHCYKGSTGIADFTVDSSEQFNHLNGQQIII